jgi:hypothetical protein
MTECIDQLRFGFHPNRDVVATFDAPESSSDGGLLLLRSLDERMGLTRAFAERIPDRRDPRFIVHPRLLLSLEDGFVQSLSKRRKLVVLDIDPTDDPTHGAQQMSFFHGYYDTHMYFPLLVFDGKALFFATPMTAPRVAPTFPGRSSALARSPSASRRRCPSCNWTRYGSAC